MDDTAPKCPFCGKIQSDCSNGGDPGQWWLNEFIPYGDCEIECDGCQKEFTVRVNWTPSFTGLPPEEAEE